MSDNILELSNRRNPTTYTVTITHHWDGAIESYVHDVADDQRSRDAVAYALRRVAETYLNKQVGASGDDMLAIMLANIDHAMSCTDEAPAVFKVGPGELAAWADAVQKYEEARFPMKGETP
jgi:hypothetical protein